MLQNDVLQSIFCIVRAVLCIANHRSRLITPHKWRLLTISCISLLLYYPVKRYLLRYEVRILKRFLWTSNLSLRILGWSQTHFFTSFFLSHLRKEWLECMKKVVAMSELRESSTESFKRTPSNKSNISAKDQIVYVWYKCRASPYLTRSVIFFLSAPLNYIPIAGPCLYFWWHSGVKARVAARAFAQTEAEWNKLSRVKWVAQNWTRLRYICLAKILVAIIPFIGVFLTMVLDLALMIWICDEKLSIRLKNTQPEHVYQVTGLSDALKQNLAPDENRHPPTPKVLSSVTDNLKGRLMSSNAVKAL